MENDVTGRVWILVTPGEEVLSEKTVKVKYVYWLNPIAVGDGFEMVDLNEDVVLVGRCEVANGSQVFNLECLFNGLKLPVLDSGTLYVYLA
jgi:hypothetical protein